MVKWHCICLRLLQYYLIHVTTSFCEGSLVYCINSTSPILKMTHPFFNNISSPADRYFASLRFVRKIWKYAQSHLRKHWLMDAGGLSRCSPLTVMLIRILKISLEEIRDPRQYNSYQERKSFCNGGNMSGVWCQHTLHNSISIISIKLSIKPVTDRPSYIRWFLADLGCKNRTSGGSVWDLIKRLNLIKTSCVVLCLPRTFTSFTHNGG